MRGNTNISTTKIGASAARSEMQVQPIQFPSAFTTLSPVGRAFQRPRARPHLDALSEDASVRPSAATIAARLLSHVLGQTGETDRTLAEQTGSASGNVALRNTTAPNLHGKVHRLRWHMAESARDGPGRRNRAREGRAGSIQDSV